MSLTTGRGPPSTNPAGPFSQPIPPGVVYVEPFPRRVRAVLPVGGTLIVEPTTDRGMKQLAELWWRRQLSART